MKNPIICSCNQSFDDAISFVNHSCGKNPYSGRQTVKGGSTRKKAQTKFGIETTGYQKNAEIILDIKTAKLVSKILGDAYSVPHKTRENLNRCLTDRIEACTQ